MTTPQPTTARPLSAAIAWAAKDAIFCEIPCTSGPPLIVRYRKTAEGLQAALNVLLETPEVAHRTITASHPLIKRPKVVFDEGERATVQGVLKKLGII